MSKYNLKFPDAGAAIPEWAGKRADEPFPVREYLESRMPPARNAADFYLVGLADFNPALKWVFPESEQAAQEQRSQELVDRLKSVIGLINDNPDQPLPPDAYQVLIDTSPAIRMVDRAQKIPDCLFLSGLEFNSQLVHAQAANILSIRARIELIQAITPLEFAQVEEALHRYFRLSRDLRLRGLCITQLVAISLENSIWREMENNVLPCRQLTSDQCDKLLAIIQEHEQRGLRFEDEACRVEYIVLGNTLDALKAGRIKPADMDIPSLTSTRVNYELEWATASRLTKERLNLLDRPLHETIKHNTAALEYQKIREGVARNAISWLFGAKLSEPLICLSETSSFDEIFEAACRTRTRLGAIRCLIAVRRYEINHDIWPEDLLPALREAGMDSVPIDHFCGEPLRYKLIDGKPVLYSVGRDLKDDEGLVDWDLGNQPGDLIFRIENPISEEM